MVPTEIRSKWLLKQLWFMTELESNVTHSRLEQQQSSWMSQKRAPPEEERRELRIWMRRKQRERLAVYQKHRESLREREHKPFSTSGKVVRCVCLFIRTDNPLYALIEIFYPHCCWRYLCVPPQKPATKNRATIWRTREEKEKYVTVTLPVHNKHACALLLFPFDVIGSCCWSNTTRGPVRPVLWPVSFPPTLQPCSFLQRLKFHLHA